MDRLVELFIQSARYGESGDPTQMLEKPQDGGQLDAEGIENGIAAIEKMLKSEDGMRLGLAADATFVCLAMALEEKPLLQAGAARCYEKSLELTDHRRKLLREKGGSWERAVVLQQLGTVCMRQGRAKDGARWLEDSLVESDKCEGHPREASLYGGCFNTKQTRLEFIATTHKFAAKACHDIDQDTSRFWTAAMGQIAAGMACGDLGMPSNCCESVDTDDTAFAQVQAMGTGGYVIGVSSSSSKVGFEPNSPYLPSPGATPLTEEALRFQSDGTMVRVDSNHSYEMAVAKPVDPDEVRQGELGLLRDQAAALQRVVRKPDKDSAIVTHYEEELKRIMDRIHELEHRDEEEKRRK